MIQPLFPLGNGYFHQNNIDLRVEIIHCIQAIWRHWSREPITRLSRPSVFMLEFSGQLTTPDRFSCHTGSAIGLKGLKFRPQNFEGPPKMILNIFSNCNYYTSRIYLPMKELNNSAQWMKNNEQDVRQCLCLLWLTSNTWLCLRSGRKLHTSWIRIPLQRRPSHWRNEAEIFIVPILGWKVGILW